MTVLPFHGPGAANVVLTTKATAPDVMPPWVRAVRLTLAAAGLLAVGYTAGINTGLSAGMDAVRAACPVMKGSGK